MLILYTLIYIGNATSQAICFGILAALLMPPVNNKINEKIIKENRKNKIIKIVTEVLAFFVIIANLPTNNANQNTKNNNTNSNIKNINANTNTKSSNTKTTQSSTKKNTATSTKKTTTQSTSTTTTDNSRTVYVTPTGKRYHYISTCGGKNSTASTLNKAKARGLTPCQKCAK